MSAEGMADFNIQRKGTDVCMDIYCSCGQQSHFDGMFAYAVKCPACGAVYDLPAGFSLSSRATQLRWHDPVTATDPDTTTMPARSPVDHSAVSSRETGHE